MTSRVLITSNTPESELMATGQALLVIPLVATGVVSVFLGVLVVRLAPLRELVLSVPVSLTEPLL